MKRYFLFSYIFLTTLLSFGQTKIESLKITMPEEYKWKVGSHQEDSKQQMVELIPGKEKIDNWTIIGTMLSLKGVTNVPMDVAMNLMFDQAKENAIKPILTLVERNDTTKHSWIIFKIEVAKFKNDNNPESQLYYIIQGETALYSNFVAIKDKTLSKEFVDKWTKVFKASELVYQ